MDLFDAIRALTQALDECHSPAMLIGGIAVIARGIPRHTDDVDGTIPPTESTSTNWFAF
jgi:hypothetical protein